MPILEVEIVLRPNETLPGNLAANLAECAGNVFGSPPGETWVKLKPIPAEEYAENGGPLSEGFYPVFVSVLKARNPSGVEMQTEVSELTAAIAQVCARPRKASTFFISLMGVGARPLAGNREFLGIEPPQQTQGGL